MRLSRRSRGIAGLALLCSWAAGCGGGDDESAWAPPPAKDSGTDVAIDGAADAVSDNAIDSASDGSSGAAGSSHDAAIDVVSDASSDGGSDATSETSVPQDAGPDGCAAGLSSCDGMCVDLQSNNLHCGGCGVACEVGQDCQQGACAILCQSPKEPCNGVCVNTQTDPANCGSCGNVCTTGQACQSGACTLTCAAGLEQCGGSCVSLQWDSSHCGACFNACAAGTTCKSGVCELQCPSGQTNCSGVCVNLQNNAANCGACGKACPTSYACSGGACILTCPPGQTVCSGACVNPLTDSDNCGGCGHACGVDQACSNGVCVLACTAPEIACSGVCKNPVTDPLNCGGCGKVCSDANILTPICSNQICGGKCLPGWGDCDKNKLTNGCETDLTTTANCGTCGNTCAVSQACVSGACQTSCNADIQTFATATISAGGTVSPYVPATAVNGVSESQKCSEFAWITAGSAADGAWIQLQWPTTRTIKSLTVDTRSASVTNACADVGRTLGAATIQWWNGSSWVTAGQVSGKQDDWSYTFTSMISTTRIRLYNLYVTGSVELYNPVLYELRVVGCN